ncbi:MAG: glucosamine-6-phosphate deaminase [Acidimicrobiia bacterium]
MPRFGALRVTIDEDGTALARHAAGVTAALLADAISARGAATAMFATGNSQLAFLDELVACVGIDWASVTAFHLDEYVGVAADHPASFRRYLTERLADRVRLRKFHFIAGDAPDPGQEAAHYADLIAANPLDVCCVGIGENGHLAFNDPPGVRFDDPAAVKVVALAEASRRQQLGEGHFATLGEVPTHAITVTIPAILEAAAVVAIVPEGRKARAVQAALTGSVTPDCPASILRDQSHAQLFLDRDAAALVQ